MNQSIFSFNEKQRKLIQAMNVPDMIELFSLTNQNVGDFLYAMHREPKEVYISSAAFELSHFSYDIVVRIEKRLLSHKADGRWVPLGENYRILGIYLSEHLGKDPFLFLKKPEIKKPKLTMIDIFFEMSLSQLGQTAVTDLLQAEVLPPVKQRMLKKTLERSQAERSYTVSEIFTKMPLSRVGNLKVSQFFGAEVFPAKKSPRIRKK